MNESEYHLRQTVEPDEVPGIAVQLEPQRVALLLLGSNGTGKTWAAKAAVKEISRNHNDGEPMPIVECNSGLRPGWVSTVG